jgi:hypothetical protein
MTSVVAGDETKVDRTVFCSLYGLRNKRAPFVGVIGDEEHVFDGSVVNNEKAKALVAERASLDAETKSLRKEREALADKITKLGADADPVDTDRVNAIDARLEENSERQKTSLAELFVARVPGYYPDATRKIGEPLTEKMMQKYQNLEADDVYKIFEFDWHVVFDLMNQRTDAIRPKITTSSS